MEEKRVFVGFNRWKIVRLLACKVGIKELVYSIVLKGGSAVEGGLLTPASQGSNGSPLGSCSSGISETLVSTTSRIKEMHRSNSPSSVQSRPKNEQSGEWTAMQNHSPVAETRVVLEDMPCVSTTGDGPDGKRIEGFLYRYRNGEEVRIVCVRHGSSLSPAVFVKHAGGSDATHRLSTLL